ncbi:efflux RND transporter permease subunit [Alkalisalibacterium limincola]|uniref:efflux RND transporter permease subunit n=1 Tax=Alkalisalibacterium limincola TaxID=2699169 RepID=UPI003CCD4C5E
MIETVIQLHPPSQWRDGMTMDKLVQELDAAVQVPGLTNAWVPPILNRINMQVSGIRTPLGLQVSGPELPVLSQLATDLAARLQGVEGTRSAFAEQVAGARYIEVEPNRQALARHGLSMGSIQSLLASVVGGESVSTVIEGRERYPIAVRLPQSWRDSPEALAELPLVTPSGSHVQLGSIADIRISDGPPMIRSEDARPTTFVFLDLADADMGGWIRRAEQVLAETALPAGYSWDWAGTHVYMERAKARLWIAVPLTLVIVFGLFYMAFGRAIEAGIVMLTLPLAVVGGVWLLWLLGYAWSVAVAVGFIALAGVAAEFGVIMLIYLNSAVKRARERGGLGDMESLELALTEGALRRIRPKAMTVITIIAGLLPIMLASGAGAATMQRIAAPMLGGMITAALLSLLVIPAVYRLLLGREVRRSAMEPPLNTGEIQ